MATKPRDRGTYKPTPDEENFLEAIHNMATTAQEGRKYKLTPDEVEFYNALEAGDQHARALGFIDGIRVHLGWKDCATVGFGDPNGEPELWECLPPGPGLVT